MKVAICDEDKASCAKLRRLILEQEPECEVVCFYTGRDFENACREARKQAALSGEQLFFQTKLRSYTVMKNEILYVESKKRKVEVHTLRNSFTVYVTMKHMEEQLGRNFYRCHRGYLVNLAYVTEYGLGTIRLSGGEIIYMAREKYSDFTRAYTEYLEREGIRRV